MEGPDLAKNFMLVLLHDALDWACAKTRCSERITRVITGVRSVFVEDMRDRKMFMLLAFFVKMRQY